MHTDDAASDGQTFAEFASAGDVPPPVLSPEPISDGRRLFLLPPIRLLIAVVGAVLLSLVVGVPLGIVLGMLGATDFFQHPEIPSSFVAAMLASEFVMSVGAVGASLFVTLVVERSGAGPLGRSFRAAVKETALGFAGGAVLMSAIVLLMAALGWYRLSGPTDVGAGPLLGTVVAFFLVALFEETLFRGVVFRILEDGLGTGAALVLSSLAFGAVHLMNANASLTAGLGIALEAGILLAAAYLLTRTIWPAVGIHWAWNLFQGDVFGAAVSGNPPLPTLMHGRESGPDRWSGGAFGPEAGLTAILLATAAGLAVLYVAWRLGRFRTPLWWQARRRRAAPTPAGPD